VPADLDEARERLKEWACHYRDRARQGIAGSAEGSWRSPQIWEAPRPRPVADFRRAVETHALLRDRVPTPNFRALTFRYCWPWLPVGIALMHLTRRVGYCVTMRIYEDLLAIGEHRLAAAIDVEEEKQPARGGRSCL
jgi:hypothetical protein